MGKMDARPVVVVAHTRSGGCWLMHCLSSHPDISCPRGEPLLPASNYRRSFPDVSDVDILRCIGTPEQYRIGAAKVTYNQFTPEIEKWVAQGEVPIIHLTRRNLLRVVVSQLITGLAVSNRIDHVAHSYKTPYPVQVELPAERILGHCRRMTEKKLKMEERLRQYRHLDIYYADLVGGEGHVSQEMDPVQGALICDFLDIQRTTMTAQLKRVNAHPLERLLTNWAEVQYAVKHSPFAWCLKDEENFK